MLAYTRCLPEWLPRYVLRPRELGTTLGSQAILLVSLFHNESFKAVIDFPNNFVVPLKSKCRIKRRIKTGHQAGKGENEKRNLCEVDLI